MEVMTAGKRPKFWKRLLLAYVEEKFNLSSKNKCVKIIITRLFSVICCLWYLLSCMPCKYMYTRMHSNRMRTARALTVSPSMLCTRGVSARGVSARGVSAPRRVSARGGVCYGGGWSALGGVCSWGVSAGGSAPCLLQWGSALGGCLLLGGVCSGGGVSAPGGSALGDLLWGVSAPGGVSALGGCLLRGGGCLLLGEGVSAPRGGGESDTWPLSEQNSWHTSMKILSCPKLRLRAVNM